MSEIAEEPVQKTDEEATKDFYDKIEILVRKEIEENGFKNSSIKLEDFDFTELVSDLTNSVTDQLYREFPPSQKALW